MGVIIDKFVIPMPDIRSLPSAEARIVISFRIAIIAHKVGRDCRTRLSEWLGSRSASVRLLILAETIGFAWPEPFKIGCPCSTKTTPDEMLFLNMFRHTVAGDRPAYDALLCDMIDDSGRERIFHDIQNFSAAYKRP